MLFFFFKQKTAYEMRISDWSSDVCSSDLSRPGAQQCRGGDGGAPGQPGREQSRQRQALQRQPAGPVRDRRQQEAGHHRGGITEDHLVGVPGGRREGGGNGEAAVKGQQPERHRGGGPEARGQEEGTAHPAKQRRASKDSST